MDASYNSRRADTAGWGFVSETEVPQLRQLGRELQAQREGARLTQSALAQRSGVSRRHLQRLERGDRRTRSSTLRRIAVAICGDTPSAVEGSLGRLLDAAGPALADESEFQARVERRRSRRTRKPTRIQVELFSHRSVGTFGIARVVVETKLGSGSKAVRSSHVTYRLADRTLGWPDPPSEALLISQEELAVLWGLYRPSTPRSRRSRWNPS